MYTNIFGATHTIRLTTIGPKLMSSNRSMPVCNFSIHN